MKIEWLNDDMSEAVVTIGWFRKRQAKVRRVLDYGSARWVYMISDDRCHYRNRLERERERVLSKRWQEKHWQPVGSKSIAVPAAKVVRR